MRGFFEDWFLPCQWNNRKYLVDAVHTVAGCTALTRPLG
ncbi:hypothetical protein D1BOALGB6SA_5878 [Olavius sp. associated proteobacterium Delta 1]|nr:hypothetical protein D1BOALGB6SA_5878 [Olavius sp. associated proteobacterium Delta 1]